MIASNWNLADSPQPRLRVALALSFAVHLAILFGVSVPAPLQIAEDRTIAPRISVEYRSLPIADGENLGVAEAVSAAERPEPVNLREPEPLQPSVDSREARDLGSEQESIGSSESSPRKLLVDELRVAWRDEEAGSGAGAPHRLTDEIKLDAQERAYLAAWQRKVQRIGRLNFPADDQGNRLRGSLRLLVGIEADGSLAYAQVTESSGDVRLDAAAVDIVRLASPYAPIPPSLRRSDAILEIERTWRIGASLVEM